MIIEDNRFNFFKHFPKNSKGAEIGVDAGGNCYYNLLPIIKPKMLYLIDMWDDLFPTKRNLLINRVDNNLQLKISKKQKYDRIVKTLGHKDNITILKYDSSEACKYIEDNSLDWVYIDGCHTYESVTKDLTNYYPKVKKGGIISGDDYNEMDDILAESKKAIDDFMKKHNKEFFLMSKEKSVDWAFIK